MTSLFSLNNAKEFLAMNINPCCPGRVYLSVLSWPFPRGLIISRSTIVLNMEELTIHLSVREEPQKIIIQDCEILMGYCRAAV